MNKKALNFEPFWTSSGRSTGYAITLPGMSSAHGGVRPIAGSAQLSEGKSSEGSGNIAVGLPLSASGTASLPVGTAAESARSSMASSASSARGEALAQYDRGVGEAHKALNNIGIGPQQLEQMIDYLSGADVRKAQMKQEQAAFDKQFQQRQLEMEQSKAEHDRNYQRIQDEINKHRATMQE